MTRRKSKGILIVRNIRVVHQERGLRELDQAKKSAPNSPLSELRVSAASPQLQYLNRYLSYYSYVTKERLPKRRLNILTLGRKCHKFIEFPCLALPIQGSRLITPVSVLDLI